MTSQKQITIDAFQAFFPMVNSFAGYPKTRQGAVRRFTRAGYVPGRAGLFVIETDDGHFVPVCVAVDRRTPEMLGLIHVGICVSDQRALQHYGAKR
tara:strand:+ start:7712 stop:7999 length:288 start_codon:yes stop_codon:yes gene_type:complete